MCKPLLFYTVPEYSDTQWFYRSKGLKPHKIVVRTLDNDPIPFVVQYSKKGYLYDVLNEAQCYSGCPTTLMCLPKLSYDTLLNVALTSRHFCERAGAIGMILKEYPVLLEGFLRSISQKNVLEEKERMQVIRLARCITEEIHPFTSYIDHLTTILSLCQKIISAYAKKSGSAGRNQKKAMTKLNKVIAAIQLEDAKTLRSLFSENALQEAEGFDDASQSLFSYFSGEVISCTCNDWAGPSAFTSRDGGHTQKVLDCNFDIQTTEAYYRVAMLYVTTDTADPGNEGIHCLYVLRTEDGESFGGAYYGDGLDTPGIHIGIPNKK